MRGRSRLCASLFIAGFLSLVLVGPAFAGGWANVTLDWVPQRPAAGQPLSLGFMVRQHGVTPIDTAFGGPPMAPRLTARNATTGETVQATARKEGPVGHFVVDLAFPSAGEWSWTIAPEPFGPTDLGTLTVVAAGAVKGQPVAKDGAAQGQLAATPLTNLAGNLAQVREGMRWLGIALLAVALGLALWGQRLAPPRRGPAARS